MYHIWGTMKVKYVRLRHEEANVTVKPDGKLTSQIFLFLGLLRFLYPMTNMVRPMLEG